MNREEINIKKLIKQIIIILVIFAFLFLALYIIYVLTMIDKTKYEGISQSQKVVKDEKVLNKIFERYEFVEEKTYHIFYGKNNEDEYLYVFVPKEDINNPSKWTNLLADQVVNQDKVKSTYQKDCNECDFKHIKPAMIDDTAVWELAYYDNNNIYYLDYINMETNERLERLRLK